MTIPTLNPETAAYLQSLAARMREYRARNGLKQPTVAAMMGVSSSTVSGIENNPLAVTANTIRLLAENIPEFGSAFADYVATLQPPDQQSRALTPHQRQIIRRVKELLDELLANG